MAKKLSYIEFNQAISSRTMQIERLADYVSFDPTNAYKLVFRTDALLDIPPTEYNVNETIYRFLRSISNERQARFSCIGTKLIVIEGDSWFNLPECIGLAIGNWIEKHGQFRVNNIAHWGSTLQEILKNREYITVLERDKPDYFLFTAGGNDLQNQLTDYVFAYDRKRPLDDYLTDEGKRELERIEQSYHTLFEEVFTKYPTLPILCHGYDYPRPLISTGYSYIGPSLKQKGIPDNLMTSIMSNILDKLNSVISSVANLYKTVTFLDCRHVTDLFTWIDDMHPASDGFEAIAIKFEDAMNRILL